MPEFWLLTTDGFHVRVIPLSDMVGNTGGVVPAQKGGMGLKMGTYIGSDKIIPVNKFVVHPLICKTKLE